MRNDNRLGKRLGKIICQRRHELGLSQEALAFSAGLHRTSISLIELGKKSPTIETIFSISTALKTKPSILVAMAEGDIPYKVQRPNK